MEPNLFVSGLFSLVAAGLLAYLVLTWLKYQREVSKMDSRETQLLQQCEMNTQASALAREKNAAVVERCRELEHLIPGLREELNSLRRAEKERDEGKG